MRIRMLTLTVALMALPATTTFADVACKMILQELKAGGRTPQDVMDTYLATPSDIKACREKADREAQEARMRGGNSVPGRKTAMPEGSKGQ
jgi:hypothetical protein